jgi:hypothetical protein
MEDFNQKSLQCDFHKMFGCILPTEKGLCQAESLVYHVLNFLYIFTIIPETPS